MSDPCIYCGHVKEVHDEPEVGGECACGCPQWRDEPTDSEATRSVYVPDSRGENDRTL